jgi:hypothetical protein
VSQLPQPHSSFVPFLHKHFRFDRFSHSRFRRTHELAKRLVSCTISLSLPFFLSLSIHRGIVKQRLLFAIQRSFLTLIYLKPIFDYSNPSSASILIWFGWLFSGKPHSFDLRWACFVPLYSLFMTFCYRVGVCGWSTSDCLLHSKQPPTCTWSTSRASLSLSLADMLSRCCHFGHRFP